MFETKTAKRLHVLRAHILHSEGLLARFKSIITEVKSETKDNIVINECKKLLLECDRFEFQRRMHEERAKHIIDIVRFLVNFIKRTKLIDSQMYNHSADRAAEASVRDSRDMMQVS